MFRSLLGSSSGLRLKTKITHTEWRDLLIKVYKTDGFYAVQM
jgi:hypothetical protein